MGFFHRLVLSVALASGAGVLLTPAHAQKRVALVIGNDRYAHLPALRNAVADARAIGQVLEELGFRLFKGENLEFRATNRLHADFEAAIVPGDTAFVFFAGHGVALGAENYLLPIDLPKPRAGEENLVRTESHGVDTLVRRIQAKGALASFFVIDACRDNPFEQVGVRSIGGTRGLARVDAPSGVFVLFSAGIGQTALDRLSDNDRSPNSIFTRTLVPLLRQQGLSHLVLAKRVQTEVRELALSVRHPQQPAFYDQIIGEVVFKPAPPAPPVVAVPPPKVAVAPPPVQSPPAPPPPPRADPCAAAAEHWRSAKSIGTLAALEDHLAWFPSCAFAGLSRAKVQALKAAPAQPSAAPPAAEKPSEGQPLRLGALIGTLLGPRPVPSAPPAEPAAGVFPSVRPAPPQQSTKVLVAAVIGPPDAVSRQLTADVAKAIEDQRVAVGSGPTDTPNYTLRGYVIAAREISITRVTFTWDVIDGTGNRIHRITGDERVAGESRDPWAVVTPQLTQTIATKVAVALGAWATRGSR